VIYNEKRNNRERDGDKKDGREREERRMREQEKVAHDTRRKRVSPGRLKAKKNHFCE
jgi:hypothetical protein